MGRHVRGSARLALLVGFIALGFVSVAPARAASDELEFAYDGFFKLDLAYDSAQEIDIFRNGRGGGGGEGERPFDLEFPGQPGNFQIIGAKVVPPFADAVRFIDRQKRDLCLRDCVEESLIPEPFR